MLWVTLASFLVIAAVAVLLFRNRHRGISGTVGLPYVPAAALFTAAERSFLIALDSAVGPAHRVFGKVRVADVAEVRPGLRNSARQGALNHIASEHFNFVVCRTSDLAAVCAVELNDKSHSSPRAQARDDLLAKVCHAISLPLLQVATKEAYSPQELRSEFVAALTSTQSRQLER